METPTAKNILTQISEASTKLGDLRKIADSIKKNHNLAMEFWSTGKYFPRQLAILIMDKKMLSMDFLNDLFKDIEQHPENEKLHLTDWLMANQLVKDKKTIAFIESWADGPSSLQRRIFWYYQGRLRWVGQNPPPNSEALLDIIDKNIEKEKSEVQWAMNFTAGQIGIFQEEFRERCSAIGERTGLYKDEIVAKNCTPNYLPKYIAIQVAKLKKQK
jgi:3-methyladenine DNA glycosylase AlkD